jgi:hypothetical protein
MKSNTNIFSNWKTPKLSFNPWPYFISFLFANSALAYTSWPLITKLFIGVFFIVLPALIAWLILREHKASSDPEPVDLPDPPIILYWIFGALLLWTQFYHLESNPFWPTMDDARVDYYAFQLSHLWDWRLLYGEGQAQPLYLWLLGLVLRFTKPTFFIYALLPALIFIFSIGIAYWSARRFFLPGLSLAIASFLAFGFAPYTISRFHQTMCLTFLLECLLLGWMGLYCRGPQTNTKVPALLGFILGIGFYTYTIWGAIAIWCVSLVLLNGYYKKRFSNIFWVGIISFLIALPIFTRYLSPHGTDYYYSHFNPTEFGIPFLIGLFWNGGGCVPYGPNWGGWYNSLYTSLIFLGFLQLYRHRTKTWVQACVFAFAIFYIPGALTKDVEMLRFMSYLPLAALCAALGVGILVQTIRPPSRWAFILFILGISTGLDTYHYIIPYSTQSMLPPDKRAWRSEVSAKAYDLLKKKAEQNGPGLIFHAFSINYPDRSLEIYADSFNALQNPALNPDQAKWIALVCNINFLPFLEKRFPNGEWYCLQYSSDTAAFGIFPRALLTPAELENWIQTHRCFSEMNRLALYKRPDQAWTLLEPELQKARLCSESDPLLQSVFAEKAIQYYVMIQSLPSALQMADWGIHAGYPSAYFYNTKGCLLNLSGKYPEAKQCFQQACASPGHWTSAVKNLEALERQHPTSQIIHNP